MPLLQRLVRVLSEDRQKDPGVPISSRKLMCFQIASPSLYLSDPLVERPLRGYSYKNRPIRAVSESYINKVFNFTIAARNWSMISNISCTWFKRLS